jgi:drug/metabolite transporter (DMT)-like permease
MEEIPLWIIYGLIACITYAVFSGSIVVFTNSRKLKNESFTTLALLVLSFAGILSLLILFCFPNFKNQITKIISSNGNIHQTVFILIGISVLMIITHVCVYFAIINAPNAGYAQSIVNISALLLALGMWIWYKQPLSRLGLGGMVLIVIGCGMLKMGSI